MKDHKKCITHQIKCVEHEILKKNLRFVQKPMSARFIRVV